MYLCEGKLIYLSANGISNLYVTVMFSEPDEATLDDKMQDLMCLSSNVKVTGYSLRELTLVSQTRFKKGDELCKIQAPVYSLPRQEKMTSAYSLIFTPKLN